MHVTHYDDGYYCWRAEIDRDFEMSGYKTTIRIVGFMCLGILIFSVVLSFSYGFDTLLWTLIPIVVIMGITLLLGVPAAYGMGRYKVRGISVFLLTFLVSQMLPASLTLTPLYLIFNNVGLLGNHFASPIAIAASSIPFAIITLRPFFRSVPVTLDEAARLDGCGPLRAFFYVMIPAVKTGIITIVVISFLNGWNDLVYSMTFNVGADMRPLTANIYKFQSAYGTKWNCIMAYGTILVLPVILLFIFLQKYIVGGLTAGAVKE